MRVSLASYIWAIDAAYRGRVGGPRQGRRQDEGRSMNGHARAPFSSSFIAHFFPARNPQVAVDGATHSADCCSIRGASWSNPLAIAENVVRRCGDAARGDSFRSSLLRILLSKREEAAAKNWLFILKVNLAGLHLNRTDNLCAESAGVALPPIKRSL